MFLLFPVLNIFLPLKSVKILQKILWQKANSQKSKFVQMQYFNKTFSVRLVLTVMFNFLSPKFGMLIDSIHF